MSNRIIKQPDEVWDFFYKNLDTFTFIREPIAEDAAFGVTVFVTEENGRPTIEVFSDDDRVYEEQCMNKSDCTETVGRIYDQYLGAKIVNMACAAQIEEQEEEDEYTRFQIEDEMATREALLDSAVYLMMTDFLETPLDELVTGMEADEIYEDMKDHIAEYLYRRWGLSIYRPMYLEDENGIEFFEDYPYGCMEFEDEDNPLYASASD